jgi:hypothetical protein
MSGLNSKLKNWCVWVSTSWTEALARVLTPFNGANRVCFIDDFPLFTKAFMLRLSTAGYRHR